MTPEEALKHIFITYGRSLLQEPKRVKNLLNDLCPRLEPSNKREMHALVLVMDENIPSELIACTAIDEVRLRRLVQRLLDASFIPEDVALKSLQIWGHALGLALPTLAPQSAMATPSNTAGGVNRPATANFPTTNLDYGGIFCKHRSDVS